MLLLFCAVAVPAAPAQRIVSLAPHLTELAFAAGAGPKLVAASDYSDFPPEAARLPRVASATGIDIERILALQPDLVLAWRLDATAKALDRLESLGLRVVYIEPHRLDEIPRALETVGVLAGTEPIAAREAARLREELDRLKIKYSGMQRIDVFYQAAERPLMTLNGTHFVSDAIRLCGGRNVFADAPLIASPIDAEAVLAANPQVIVAARTDPADTRWQEQWLRFPAMRAVRDGNLLAIDAEQMSRHGPRAIAATGKLCALLDEARAREAKAPR
ncbi:MAG TPA: cobalamin-binding protein [Steroidobacteraceae bacterium]|nr:cobalamin-binding protein [Steroidobacteraceae bacterium]